MPYKFPEFTQRAGIFSATKRSDIEQEQCQQAAKQQKTVHGRLHTGQVRAIAPLTHR